jgi:WS/DGAT/MGAT family acyltransferase
MQSLPTTTPAYQRLSGQDAAFLSFEGPSRPMHIGALAFISNEGWTTASGELDTDRLHRTLVQRARAIPGLDRVLGRTPIGGWPLWIPRRAIDWSARVVVDRQARSESEIRALAEAAMAQPFDRRSPLWRIEIVPGLDGRFALLFLAHHSLVDGIAGIDLLAQLLDERPGHDRASQPPEPVQPPSHARLLLDEARRWLALPFSLAAATGGTATDRKRARRALRRSAALVRTIVRILTPGPRTLLRGANEGARTVAWFGVEEVPLRAARGRLGGTPNDLVLAAVARALNEMPATGKRFPFRNLRSAIPVSLRTRAERHALGNRLGLQLTPLDAGNGVIARSVARIHAAAQTQKRRADAEGYEVLTDLTAWTGLHSQRLLHWIASRVHSYGILVTNVPGPSRKYTLGGAPLEEIYPLVPLFGSQVVSVAVVRYGGYLRVGVTSSWTDRAMVETFTRNLRQAFAEIPRAARDVAPAPVPARLAVEPGFGELKGAAS